MVYRISLEKTQLDLFKFGCKGLLDAKCSELKYDCCVSLRFFFISGIFTRSCCVYERICLLFCYKQVSWPMAANKSIFLWQACLKDIISWKTLSLRLLWGIYQPIKIVKELSRTPSSKQFGGWESHGVKCAKMFECLDHSFRVCVIVLVRASCAWCIRVQFFSGTVRSDAYSGVQFWTVFEFMSFYDSISWTLVRTYFHFVYTGILF